MQFHILPAGCRQPKRQSLLALDLPHFLERSPTFPRRFILTPAFRAQLFGTANDHCRVLGCR
jgi:hypothetical protein